MKEEKAYWEDRAKTYGSLDDVKSKRTAYKIINQIKKFGLNRGDVILDVGCAEGTITRTIRDSIRHSKVIGIDLSDSMIDKARILERDGLRFFSLDFFAFWDYPFNLVLMSLVLHHMIDGNDIEAIKKVYNSHLEENGKILIAEAVPPEDEIFDYYKDIFELKEERNCYLVSDLVKMLRSVGFYSVRSTSFKFNIRLKSWLNDETLSEERRNLLWDMHINSPSKFKKAYNMTPIVGGDYSLSCKMALVYGTK